MWAPAQLALHWKTQLYPAGHATPAARVQLVLPQSMMQVLLLAQVPVHAAGQAPPGACNGFGQFEPVELDAIAFELDAEVEVAVVVVVEVEAEVEVAVDVVVVAVAELEVAV